MTWERRAARLREELAAALEQAGLLPDPAWREAFARVPRHVFVPAYHEQPSGRLVTRADPAWLPAVYSDQALVTARGVAGQPVSASTQPSLMAGMLHALDVSPSSTVLEIGTGTGYNAALLAHRLGDRRVTTMDLSPALTAAARARLALAGYRPRVITGDGARAWPPGAPYDRVIATCAVPAVPPPWLAQLAPRGVVVAPLGLAVVRLARTGERTGRGRFTGPAYFMPLRPPAGGAAPWQEPRLPVRAPRWTDLGPADLADLADPAFRFLACLTEPGLAWADQVSVGAPDGSTARLNADGTVIETGPSRLWAALEAAHRDFLAVGRPGIERFGLSVGGADGREQRVWLDDVDGPSWPLSPFR